jgi:ketosteroid isomerase-like protein
MSNEGIAVLQEFNGALIERGEIRWDLIDEDISVVDHDIPDSGDYRGHRGFEKWLVEDWGSAWESYTIEPEKMFEVGEDVVISVFTVIARGKGSGVEIKARNATVNEFRDGRMARVDYYTTEEEALEAAGVVDRGEV